MLPRVLTVCGLLLLLLCGASPLLAQRTPGVPVTFRSPAQLALNPGVLSELGIEKDAPVVAELTKLSEKIRQDFEKKFRETREANAEGNLQDGIDKLAAEYNPEVKKLLTADQYNRLRQIQLQPDGNRVFRDPEVIAALELTEDQQKQIAEATREAFSARAKLLNQEESIADVRKQSREVTSDWKNEVEKILSKEQWERFEKLENRDKLGFRSLTEDDIAKQLEITQEQREKLETLKNDMRGRLKKIFDAANARGNRVPDEVQEKVKGVTADQDKKIAGILTADQQKRLADLKGKPFDRSKLRPRPEPKAE